MSGLTESQWVEYAHNTLHALTRKSIAFKPVFVDLTGSVSAGLMLSQAYYWSDGRTTQGEGWFYKSHKEWQEETRLSRWEQKGAREKLRQVYVLTPDGREVHIWEEDVRGVPGTLHYRVNAFALGIALQILQSGKPEFAGYYLVAPEVGRVEPEESEIAQDLSRCSNLHHLDDANYTKQMEEIASSRSRNSDHLIHRVPTENTQENTAGAVSPAAAVAPEPAVPPGESITHYMRGVEERNREFGHRERKNEPAEYAKAAREVGMPDAESWRKYYDHLADACGLLDMIDAMDGSFALDNLRKSALALLRMGIKDIAALDALIGAWKAENDWRLGSMTPEALAKYQSKRMAEMKAKPVQQKAKGMVTVEYEQKIPGETAKTVRVTMTRKEYNTGKRMGINYRIIED